MSNIEQNLAKILNSRYGKDVRQSIHDGIHNCYEDGKAGSIDLVARELIQQKMSGAPHGTYPTLTELQAAKPSGDGGIYITLDDGKWCYWNGSAWVAGGMYQAVKAPASNIDLEDSATAFNGSTVDEALLEMATALRMPAASLISNGDFGDGVTGWSGISVNHTVEGNVLRAVSKGEQTSQYSYQDVSFVAGHKYYFKCRARVLTANANRIYLRAALTTGVSGQFATVENPVAGQWYELSGIVTAAATDTQLRIYQTYPEVSTTHTMELMWVVGIDLTATFGAGSEPDLSKVDKYMSVHANRFFKGTATIFVPYVSMLEDATKAASEIAALESEIEALSEMTTSLRMPAENLLSNSDFSDGRTDWYSGNNFTLDVSDNVISMTSLGTLGTPYIYQRVSMTSGHKYYLRVYARSTSADCTRLVLRTNLSANNITIWAPTINEWYDMSVVFDASTDSDVRLYTYYSSKEAGSGDISQAKYFALIDLTDAFGAGDEPSLDRMNLIMDAYTNKHFNGTSDTIIRYKTLVEDVGESAKTLTALASVNGFADGAKYYQITGDRAFNVIVQLHNNVYMHYRFAKDSADDYCKLWNTGIGTFANGTFTAITNPTLIASNTEFAMTFRPSGAVYDWQFFPEHSGIGTAFAESQKLFFDGVEVVDYTPTDYAPFDTFRLEQVVDAIHPSDLTETHLMQMTTIHSMDKGSTKLNLSGYLNVLADTQIASGYVCMFPAATAYCNQMRTNFGKIYPTTATDGSTTDLTVEGDFLTGVVAENTGTYARYQLHMDFDIPEETMRRGEAGRNSPVCWISHRADGNVQKLYPQIFLFSTLSAGFTHRFGYKMYMVDV